MTHCPLSVPEQHRNLFVFATCTFAQYLAAPVLYVGMTQASLCKFLGADARVSNLPSTMYFAMTGMAAVFAWLSPGVTTLRRNMVLLYLASATMLGATALVLHSPFSNSVKIAVVILQGAVSGAVMPAAIGMLWEVIARGTDESRRAFALGLAFGVGPMMAVVGSFVQTWYLGGELYFWEFEGAAYPTNFVTLFALGVPIMVLSATASYFAVVPLESPNTDTNERAELAGLAVGMAAMIAAFLLSHFGSELKSLILSTLGYVCGIVSFAGFTYHFRGLLTDRILFWATIVTVLVYFGNTITPNMNLFSEQVLGDLPFKSAGVQNIMRFGFKTLAGLGLGYLLLRTNPRAGLVATSLVFLSAQIWAIFATGPAYLVAFGLYGAGELVGVYAPNYIVSASRPEDLRRNTAYLTLLMCTAAPSGYVYGAIADLAQQSKFSLFEMSPTATGFRLSFMACGACILMGILIALVALPRHPQIDRHLASKP